MSSLCGAKCEACNLADSCEGCAATCGKPFGGSCIAAEYIKLGGKEKYLEFKENLKDEINLLLDTLNIPRTENLFELSGAFVNLAYPIPSGKTVKLLDDTEVYLGCQIEFGNMGVCYGVVANSTFILVCSYSQNGSEPELICYKKR